MKKLPIGFVDCEYIESGTFQGGDEETFLRGIEWGQHCVVMSSADFIKIQLELKSAGVEITVRNREEKE